MRILLQRVTQANVSVNNETIGEIQKGLVLFVGLTQGDTEQHCQKAIDKVLGLRIFSDESGRFQHSTIDVKAEILSVSQFTLYGETSKGRRPDFNRALAPKEANELFDLFVEKLKTSAPAKVATGQFGANMQVSLINDGPVTLMLEF